MKKGQTAPYSALIGIVIATLMFTAIGCAIYNMYKPKGMSYFNKLTSQLQKLEDEGGGKYDAEMTFYVEKDKALIGFNKGVEEFEKPSYTWSLTKPCYEVNFAGWFRTIFGIESGIERPEKCPMDQSCLCICELSKSIKATTFGSTILPADALYIHPEACRRANVRCETFENLVLVGGEGCPYGVFVPGMYGKEGVVKERGMKLIYYSKKGDTVSIDAKKALSKDELGDEIDKGKERAAKTMASNYFKEMVKNFRQCIQSDWESCRWKYSIKTANIPEGYKIKVEYLGGVLTTDNLKFSLYDKEEEKVEIKGYDEEDYKIYMSDKYAGFICYKDGKEEKKQFIDSECKTMTLSSKGVEEFEGGCCEPEGWRGEDKVIYLQKEKEKIYLTTRASRDLELCA